MKFLLVQFTSFFVGRPKNVRVTRNKKKSLKSSFFRLLWVWSSTKRLSLKHIQSPEHLVIFLRFKLKPHLTPFSIAWFFVQFRRSNKTPNEKSSKTPLCSDLVQTFFFLNFQKCFAVELQINNCHY